MSRVENLTGNYIGIDADLTIAEGYDSKLEHGSELWSAGLGAAEDRAFTDDERIELADVLIARWTAYRAAAVAAKEKAGR